MIFNLFFPYSSIENVRGDLYISPQNDEFETFVNGEVIGERTQIFNGDRVVIGGSHFFRINNPHCSRRSSETVGFRTVFFNINILIPKRF